MVSPAAIFTAHQHQNKTKQRERAREQHEEGRGRKKWQRDVQQKVEKINKPKLRRKIKNPEFQSYLC